MRNKRELEKKERDERYANSLSECVFRSERKEDEIRTCIFVCYFVEISGNRFYFLFSPFSRDGGCSLI